MFNSNQAARIGEMGAGSIWGGQLARSFMPTTTPQPRFDGMLGRAPGTQGASDPGQMNPILSALGQAPAGGPSGLAAGIGRYRPPTGMPGVDTFQGQIFDGLMGRMNVPAGGLMRPADAAGAIGGRTFGDNPAAYGANQALAAGLPNFTENFGGGRFDNYMNTVASPAEQARASNILRALGQPGRITWGGAAAPPAYVPGAPTGPVAAGNADEPVPGTVNIGGNLDPYLQNPGVLQGGA